LPPLDRTEIMANGMVLDTNRGESRTRVRIGLALSAVSVVFLLFDGVIKVIKTAEVTTGMTQLGYPDSLSRGIGVILLICVALYVIPRTAVLGAILLTGYLGGAVAAQVRIGNPLLGYTLFPVYVALMVWGGLYLRDARVSALIPLRSDR
jgi:DoxX-like protein